MNNWTYDLRTAGSAQSWGPPMFKIIFGRSSSQLFRLTVTVNQINCRTKNSRIWNRTSTAACVSPAFAAFEFDTRFNSEFGNLSENHVGINLGTTGEENRCELLRKRHEAMAIESKALSSSPATRVSGEDPVDRRGRFWCGIWVLGCARMVFLEF